MIRLWGWLAERYLMRQQTWEVTAERAAVPAEGVGMVLGVRLSPQESRAFMAACTRAGGVPVSEAGRRAIVAWSQRELRADVWGDA